MSATQQLDTTLADLSWFLGFLEELTSRELQDVGPQTLLRDELGWDSIDMFEVLAAFDAQGIRLPDELIGELRTIGDLHHYYCSLAGSDLRHVSSPLKAVGVELRPLRPMDHDYLYQLCTSGETLTRFRMRANTPSPEHFHRMIWDRVVAQFIVHGEHGPIGWVTSFDPDYRNRHVHVAALAAPDAQESGRVVLGLALLTSYLFSEFELRKIYAETLSGNYARFAQGAGRQFEVEGRLAEHEFVNGHYEDLLMLSTTRDRWRDVHRSVFGSIPTF